MKRNKVLNICLLIFFILINSLVFSQNSEKIELLYKLYGQKNYKTLLKKSNKLIKNNIDKEVSQYYLYKSISLFYLSFDKKYSKNKVGLVDSSIHYFEVYYSILDKKSDKISRILEDDLKVLIENRGTVSMDKQAYNYLLNRDKIEWELKKKNDIKQLNKLKSKTIKDVKSNKTIEPITLEDDTIDNTFGNKDIIETAKKYIGIRYRYGGITPAGFDCSGYTQYVYSKLGYNIPRTSRDQRESFASIDISKSRSGDLLFFSRNHRTINHVGIVVENSEKGLIMIHASSSKGVMITNVYDDMYWKSKLVSAGRLNEDIIKNIEKEEKINK